MQPDESIIEFNDWCTILLEESTNEIPEACRSKIVIVAYSDALHDNVGRKQIKHSKVHDPCHPKAIRSVCDTMDQAIGLEKEQKFANLQDTEIMNISPDSSPQNSGSELEGAEIDSIYGDRRYKSRQHRNWNSGRFQNFENNDKTKDATRVNITTKTASKSLSSKIQERQIQHMTVTY